MKPKAKYLFESSWEICNKVGGIYTVISSKANLLKQKYDNYYLIGPYFKKNAEVDLQQEKPPTFLKKIFSKLEKQEGIKCYYGKWQIEGEPNTILIDFNGLISSKNKIKKELWEDYKIDSLKSGWEFEEPVIWAVAVAKLLNEIEKVKKEKIVAHFHEWLAGVSILYLKKYKSNLNTVFTTHATMLGRSIAGSGLDLYGQLENINPEKKAYELGVQDKFQIEKASANNADVFTTVSSITALEAEKLLGRKPEVLVLNGLDISKFPSIEETSIRHVTTRDKMREFLTFHFFPYYVFDLKKNLTFFIVGRYEFKNKGMDVFIKALGKLNKTLKAKKTDKTISVFFWIPKQHKGLKIEMMENKSYYRHIKNFVQWHSNSILDKIVDDLLSQKNINNDKLLTKEFMLRVKKDLLSFQRTGTPALCTHNLDENNDEIVSSLKKEGLFNKKEDKVKAVYYPVYLDGNDGLIDLPYYDAMSGCHLGVFPSYYEPWGYTPLECAALGTPALTTDLAGFGRFIEKPSNKFKIPGIYVLKRFERTEKQIINDLHDYFIKFIEQHHKDRVAVKIHAKTLSDLADWKKLIIHYVKAHNLALENNKK